jgi:predicted ATPase/DNA-binding SARP family transcriptional activator
MPGARYRAATALLPAPAAGGTVVAVELAVLGPVLIDGQPPRGAIERALLARLLVAPGAPVPAAELVEAGWPEDRRAGATRSLRVRLTKLRALLAPEVLVRDPAGYRLLVAPGSLDADRFCRLADEAARLPATAALGRCEEALALWRGEPFAELDLVDAAAAEARRLHDVRDRVRHRRALALLEIGRPEDAARELDTLVDADPLREELVRDLMYARYRAGRHAAALDAYRALVGRLAELGLQPGPEVRELEALVLRHELPRAPSSAAALAYPTNVGARVAGVVGRADEVAAVAGALEEHRIVTVAGPGGVGKTTVATEVARERLERFADGTWIVELEPLHDAADVAAATATTLGLRRIGRGPELDDRDALQILRERLRDARVLLLLDGAERLLPELAGVARDLAAAGPGVHLLVTSRRPLGVAGEAVVPLAPLAVPSADCGPSAIEASPAGRLFMQRARAARPGWELDEREAQAVARICRRLDGLPLALELAASRLRALSATQVAERLDEGLAVLGRGTLDASIEASHALLDPGEQELFRRLSVFEGAFGLEDAEQVGGGDGLPVEQVLELLVALTEHSMVQAEGDAPRRYRMLEALRADARGRLDAEAAEAAARRHAEHLARVAAEAAARAGPEGAEAAGDPLVAWRADMDAAFRWALDRADADVALRLGAGFEALYHRFGTVALAVEYGERALAVDGGAGRHRLAALWWHVPMLLAELRVDDARAALARAHELAAEHGDAAVAAGLRALEGQVELSAGNLDAAARLLDGMAAELVALGERYTAGIAAWALGSVALARGEPAEAAALLAAACDHHAACHDVCTLDATAADLVEAATLAGREGEAVAACEQALAAAPERPLGERNTHLLHQAAVIAARGGDAGRAGELAAAAATASRRDPAAIGPWHAPAAAGDLALIAGDLAAARESYEQALALAREVRARAGPSLPASMYLLASELRLAEVARAEGDDDVALAHARAALEHARASGAPGPIAAAEAALEQRDVVPR